MVFLFGPEFRASHGPFLVIWLAAMTTASFGPAHVYANMAGRQRLVTIAFLVGVSAGTVVALTAIPSMGAVGAGLGLLVGTFIANAWLWRRIKELDGLDSGVFASGTLRLLSFGQLKRLLREGFNLK